MMHVSYLHMTKEGHNFLCTVFRDSLLHPSCFHRIWIAVPRVEGQYSTRIWVGFRIGLGSSNICHVYARKTRSFHTLFMTKDMCDNVAY